MIMGTIIGEKRILKSTLEPPNRNWLWLKTVDGTPVLHEYINGYWTPFATAKSNSTAPVDTMSFGKVNYDPVTRRINFYSSNDTDHAKVLGYIDTIPFESTVDTKIRQAIASLQNTIDAITSGDTTTAIKTFQEVIDFLDGVTDDATLIGKLNELRTLIAAKYSKPASGIPASDLADGVIPDVSGFKNMAKLVVCEESDLPSTLDPATIYVITDSGETEIEKLIIRGMEFTGGGYAPGTPAITSPSESSVDVGTIASDGSSVQQSIIVKAINLTMPLQITVNGNGFSASEQTISVAEASAGKTVSITYTNTAAGAAEATGSLVIASKEVSKTISLTAAKEAGQDTIKDYVQQGLVFHLDGINKGDNADAWTDLIGGVDFPNHGATAEEKGWDLNGKNGWLGYGTTSYNLPFSMLNCTIEVCFYDKAINQGTGAAGATAFLCSFGSQLETGTNQTNGAYVNLCNSSNTKYINGCYLDGTTDVYADPLVDSVAANTLSINKSNALHNGQALSSLDRNHWATVKGGRLIGVQNHTNGKQYYFNGKIYDIRVYNRILTPAEMLHNQHVDNIRFSLGLTLPEEEDPDRVNVLKFLHISDVHNSADAINECKSMMDNDSDIAFTILTGDYSSGSGSGSSSYSSVNTPLTNLGSKLLMVNGNHDVEDAFAKNQRNATTFLKGKVTNNEVVWGDSQGVASYWYRDFEISKNSKLRIIGVDAYEFNTAYGSRYDTVYTQTQVDWIVARMMELSSTDYLIFAMHEPPVNSTVVDYAYNQQGRMDEDIVAKRRANKFCSSRLWTWDSSLSNGNLLPMIVKAYKNQSIMATSLQQLNSLTGENILGLSLDYDFSNVQPATFLCYIGGHLHGEYAEYHPSSLYND